MPKVALVQVPSPFLDRRRRVRHSRNGTISTGARGEGAEARRVPRGRSSEAIRNWIWAPATLGRLRVDRGHPRNVWSRRRIELGGRRDPPAPRSGRSVAGVTVVCGHPPSAIGQLFSRGTLYNTGGRHRPPTGPCSIGIASSSRTNPERMVWGCGAMASGPLGRRHGRRPAGKRLICWENYMPARSLRRSNAQGIEIYIAPTVGSRLIHGITTFDAAHRAPRGPQWWGAHRQRPNSGMQAKDVPRGLFPERAESLLGIPKSG